MKTVAQLLVGKRHPKVVAESPIGDDGEMRFDLRDVKLSRREMDSLWVDLALKPDED